MPKKSIDRNRVVISSGQGTDGLNGDTTIINALDTSVNASDVISSNLGGYLGNNVQVNLDDLSADALEGQPPKLGHTPITFSNGNISITHDGRPDWGQAKINDQAPWLTQNKKWASRLEMPHYGTGTISSDSILVSAVKHINENGAYDTVNLNYRSFTDIFSDQNDYGMDVTTTGEGQGKPYTFVNEPIIYQSVPRSVFLTGINSNDVYPFLYETPYANENDINDFFNASTSTSLGLNAGTGTSSLSVRAGQASTSLGSPFRTTSYEASVSERLTDLTVEEPATRDVGLVVSGVLFPADRGVLALIRFPSDPNDVSQGISTAASTIEDIENRVIAAINLGNGAGELDGTPGGTIFNTSESNTFPSKITGQYDLYELHTGNYTSESTRSGAIPALVTTPNKPNIGQVRLLSNANAFVPSSGPSTRVGGIPVLFSPFEKINVRSSVEPLPFADFYAPNGVAQTPVQELGAYAIDSTGAVLEATINTSDNWIEITTPSGNTPYSYYAYVKKEERSFLSYRLPVLKDYSTSGIKTPVADRDRFFIKRKPNKDQEKALYESRFNTAGGYVTFGSEDNYSFQVARYRQVITLTNEYTFNGTTTTGVAGGIALDDSEPEFNYGSIALIHFKTERAFEALVRDGIAPSDNDVYSRNLLDYSSLNNNVGIDLGLTGGDGLTDVSNTYTPNDALSIFRPNLNFSQRTNSYPASIAFRTNSQVYGLHPTEGDQVELAQTNSYFQWTSGVIYISPNSWLAYKGHTSNRTSQALNRATETQYKRLMVEVDVTPKVAQGNDVFSEWNNTDPSAGLPFKTIRPSLQILTSDLTASDNILANRLSYFEDDTSGEYALTIKHQQVWANASDLEGGELSGEIGVIPTGDSSKAVNDLTQYNPKDGFCTFTTVGLRPSAIANDPHKQFENLGVSVIKDDLGSNSQSVKKKLLYHSARKISLLELYGQKLQPNGYYVDEITPIPSLQNIHVLESKGSTIFDPDHKFLESYDLIGQDYRNNEAFNTFYLQINWDNNDPATSQYTPKACGQAISIYRYDEEGHKVYVELDLLPIGGDEANGYALELCSGWDWVKNTDDTDASVASAYRYRSDVPVYRPVENTPIRLSARTHADASFIGLRNIDYYIECHPSIPYDWNVGVLQQPAPFQVAPSAWSITTMQKSSIHQLSQTYGVGNAPSTADLRLQVSIFLTGAWDSLNIYEELGDGATYIVDSRGETLPNYTPPLPANDPINSDVGATTHLKSFYAQTRNHLEQQVEYTFESPATHPHPADSQDGNALRFFGYSLIEVKPTGRRELPEYGNFTQDIRGYLTVSGMGNKPSNPDYDLHATETQTRFPLVSLFTPRKDTQERFLDESYRIEHSLAFLFEGKGDDSDSTYQFGNHSDTSNAVAPSNGDTQLRDNLIGPGLPNFGAGINGGYIAFPVRDEINYSHRKYLYDEIENELNGTALPDLMKLSHHGYAGYLRNNFHLRRIQITTPNLLGSDWLEAQVSGFPNMTRNHLSGSKYGTPPRGILVYPYQDFYGETTSIYGQDLENSLNPVKNVLLDSNTGFFLPNSNSNAPNSLSHINIDSDTWKDVAGATKPALRHAQPDYSGVSASYPEVGYLRAFDLNFGRSKEKSTHLPYWNRDWVEETSTGERVNRLSTSVEPQGLIESGDWVRYKKNADGSYSFSPIKLRLVGVDWDMISYVDPMFPNVRRDGLVHTIDNKKYLMRKRVMRVFVKVPGLTTWLDVGVMDGEVGESYVQYQGVNNETLFGQMNENGATSDKTHPSIDGAGCCVSYKETYLVEEGLVALDLDLNVGFVPAFNPMGTEGFEGSANEYEWLGSHDEYLGEKSKTIWAGNSNRHYGDTIYRKWGAGSKEAPILVKVILSSPEYPKYELHPNDPTALVNASNLTDVSVLEANLYPNGTKEIYDIWPAPNKSYEGQSYPPDDRAPTWARRGLMGIEVLRPDGSNYDYDEVIDRPEFASTNLFGDISVTNGDDDRSLYMNYLTGAGTSSSYLKDDNSLAHNGTEVVKTNREGYTFSDDALNGINDQYSLSKKGEG